MRSSTKTALLGVFALSSLAQACDIRTAKVMSEAFMNCIRPHLREVRAGTSANTRANCFLDAGCGDPVCLEYQLKDIVDGCTGFETSKWPEFGNILFNLQEKHRNKIMKHICPNKRSAEKAVDCVARNGGLPKMKMPNMFQLWACGGGMINCLRTAKQTLCDCASDRDEKKDIKRKIAKCLKNRKNTSSEEDKVDRRAEKMRDKATKMVCKTYTIAGIKI